MPVKQGRQKRAYPKGSLEKPPNRGRLILCGKCGKGGGTLGKLKDGFYAHFPECPRLKEGQTEDIGKVAQRLRDKGLLISGGMVPGRVALPSKRDIQKIQAKEG